MRGKCCNINAGRQQLRRILYFDVWQKRTSIRSGRVCPGVQSGKSFRPEASLTVEASYVMAMVVFALAVLIRTAYSQCVETTEVMKLHWRVEQLRYQEGDQEKNLDYGQVSKKSEKIEGYIRMAAWEKEITTGVHEPEDVLRFITIFEPDEQKEDE